MKLFHKLTLLFVALFVITACSDDEFDPKPVLKVHENALVFTSVAGEQDVPVDKNKSDELLYTTNSVSGTDWITVTTTAKGFSVAVQENTTSEQRIATIKVLLLKGTSSASVSVTQAAGDTRINASKEKFEFTKEENVETFFINANGKWDFSLNAVDPSWITVSDAEKDKNKLTITVVENETTKRRVATITLTGSGEECIINILQKGTMYFDFPLLTIGYRYQGEESERGMIYKNSLRDVHEFEVARGNSFIRNMGPHYDYRTISPVFTAIKYEIYDPRFVSTKTVRQVYITSTIPPLELLDDPDFLDILAYEGYEYAWKNATIGSVIYWNKEKQLSLHLSSSVYLYGETFMFLHCRLKPNDPANQVDAFKTFDAMPTFFTKWDATAAQVKEWEAARGGKFLPEDSNGDVVLAFAPNPTTDPGLIERVYSFDENTKALLNTTYLVNELEMIFYNGGFVPDWDGHAPTREFEALFAKNGYVPEGRRPASFAFDYSNSEKKLLMTTFMKRYINEGYMPRASITISPLPEDL